MKVIARQTIFCAMPTLRGVITGEKSARGSDEVALLAARQIGNDVDVEVVDALADAMLGEEGFDGESLNQRGVQIDDVIGLVQQMSEHFYD